MPGGPYHWDDSTLVCERKPLIETPFDVRKRMYETHVVDFVNVIAKQVRIDRPKSTSARLDEFMKELRDIDISRSTSTDASKGGAKGTI